MTVILTLKGVHRPHDHKKTTNSPSIILLKGASGELVVGPPGANISDVPGGVTTPGLKDLALVDNISGSCGGGWGKFMGPKRLF